MIPLPVLWSDNDTRDAHALRSGSRAQRRASRAQRESPRLRQYALLIRLDRPEGTLLLLWPTLWALWIASNGIPGLHLFTVFVLGALLTRSAGCVFNDMADSEFDASVSRTRDRPLATGTVTGTEALGVAAVLLFVAFLLVLTTNRLTVLLAFVAIPLATIYPFMKRYTYVPQFFLGIAFSWGIPMAFAAVRGEIPRVAWLLLVANLLWTVVYDTIYAMADREDDIRVGLKSTAILFGDSDRVMIGVFQVLMLITFLLLGRQLEFGPWYHAGLAVAAALAAWHQFLIHGRSPRRCIRAFRHNNWLGFAVFAGLLLEYQFGR